MLALILKNVIIIISVLGKEAAIFVKPIAEGLS